MRLKSFLSIIAVTSIALLLPCGCTPARNTAATRNYQAFITRYNIHYNGDKHYRETLDDMERNYHDDFSRILFVHPAEARGVDGVEQPSGDFTRSIEKAQKAIQLRSIKKKPAGSSSTPEQREWKRRTEYNPFLHNSWLMLGRAEYMNGDFAIASNTFLYISRHFKWIPGIVAEARTWEALCYCALNRLYEAESALERVAPDQLENKELRRVYLTALSSLHLRRSQYKEAVASITQLIELSHGKQKTRLRYLLGQTMERSGDVANAYQTFKKIERDLTTDYTTRFNARMAMSRATPLPETSKEIKSLEKLAGYGSNTDFLDQIHEAIGNLYIIQGDTAAAMRSYALAIEKSTRHSFHKAKASLSLGALYYKNAQYTLASDCYNAALPFLPADYSNLDSILKKAEALNEISPYAKNIHLQDSLIALSMMSRAQQLATAKRLAKEYRHILSNDTITAYGYSSEQIATVSKPPATLDVPQQDISWFFYNQALVKAGREQFRKIWGNRPLTDNWRLSEKNGLEEGTSIHSGSKPTDNTRPIIKNMVLNDTLQETMPDDPEYYLASIPDTPERLDHAKSIIEDGLYNIGLILRNRLDDYTAAEQAWSKLISRFPMSPHRIEVCEGLYLLYSRKNEKEKAEAMRRIILSEFGDTPLGQEMAAPDYINRKRAKLLAAETLYDRAYKAYLNNANDSVHKLYNSATSDGSTTEILPKLKFLNALAYGAEGNSLLFGNEMKDLAESYPETEMAPIATDMLRLLDSGMTPGSGTRENVKPMMWTETSDTVDYFTRAPETATTNDTLFTIDPESKHVLLFAFDKDSVNANILLYDIARYNFSAFSVRDFDIEATTLDHQSIITVQGFANLHEAERYLSVLSRSRPGYIPDGVIPVIISYDDLKTMRLHRLSINEYTDAVEASRLRDTSARLMPQQHQ